MCFAELDGILEARPIRHDGLDERGLVRMDAAQLVVTALAAMSDTKDPGFSLARTRALSLFSCATYRYLPRSEHRRPRALVVIPSSSYRRLARDPESMAAQWSQALAAWGRRPSPRGERVQENWIDTIESRYLVMIVARSSRFAVVAIRGTLDSHDLAFDTDIRLRAVTPGVRPARLHSGFLAAAGECGAELGRMLSDCEGIPVYLTGHSLGGAVAATYNAYPRLLGGLTAAGCYTFGMPRYGDRVAMATLPKPMHIRFTRDVDLVPSWPRKRDGYADVDDARILAIGGKRRGRRCEHAGPRAWRGWSRLPLAPFEAHFVEHYVTAVECLDRRCHKDVSLRP